MIDSRPISETNTLASHENAARSGGSETAHSQANSPGRRSRRFRFSEKCVFHKRTQIVFENKGLHYDATEVNPIDPPVLRKLRFSIRTQQVIENKRSLLGSPWVSPPAPPEREPEAAGTPKPMHENAQRSALPARLRVVSRRADKYRVKCALPFSSVLIRFHPWPRLLSLGVSQ